MKDARPSRAEPYADATGKIRPLFGQLAQLLTPAGIAGGIVGICGFVLVADLLRVRHVADLARWLFIELPFLWGLTYWAWAPLLWWGVKFSDSHLEVDFGSWLPRRRRLRYTDILAVKWRSGLVRWSFPGRYTKEIGIFLLWRRADGEEDQLRLPTGNWWRQWPLEHLERVRDEIIRRAGLVEAETVGDDRFWRRAGADRSGSASPS